jgi:hypothetical protein
MTLSYPINQGKRDRAIRMGVEQGLWDFINDYSVEMGISLSTATRRLVLIGARCEAEHGKARMPASYRNLRSPAEVEADQELAMMLEDEF